MRRFLYDTTVFVYAAGAEHPYRAPCRSILELATEGALAGEASVELVQEFAHVHLRRGSDRRVALELAGAVAQLCRLHAFEPGDLPLMMTLLGQHPELSARDAVHAATALNRGVNAILTANRHFDVIDGLERIDPLDATAVQQLAA